LADQALDFSLAELAFIQRVVADLLKRLKNLTALRTLVLVDRHALLPPGATYASEKYYKIPRAARQMEAMFKVQGSRFRLMSFVPNPEH
jgi:hypothetical protein